MNRTPAELMTETLVQEMTEHMATLTRSLSNWVQAEPQPLQALEAHIQRLLPELGTTLLAGLVPLAAPARPAPDLACPCGATARSQRVRKASVTTLLGPITYPRAV
jgi:hypothetical protein